ncbi:MAG: ABC transporter ATP-binding protein [Parahaliea sp.]
MIAIKNLSFRYPGNTRDSLSDIDLEIGKGQLFGLLGPNGAGKTSLLSIMSGLLSCQPDTVFIAGQDICRTSRDRLPRLSIVPQEYAFYDTLSVRENLVFFAAVQGVDGTQKKSYINTALSICRLEDQIDTRAGHLSGGLKRRLNLAIGLLNKPDLLLLDEPTVGIDPHSRSFILNTIKVLNHQGTTVVYSSHYMEEVEYLCEQIVIVDKGRILLAGSLQALFERVAERCLQLTTQRAVSEQVMAELTDVQKNNYRQFRVRRVSDDGRQLEIQMDDSGDLSALLQQLAVFGLVSVNYDRPGLEALFLDTTEHQLRD